MIIKDRELTTLPEEELRILNAIVIDEFREIAEDALEKDGTEEKLHIANKVGDVILNMLKRKNLISAQTHQAFVDVMLTAAMLHNIYYDESDWTTLFQARKIVMPLALEKGLHKQSLDALFHTIESQLGEQTPVTECIPKPGTPTEIFASAVWFVKTYMV